MDDPDDTILANYPRKCEKIHGALKPRSRIVMAADVVKHARAVEVALYGMCYCRSYHLDHHLANHHKRFGQTPTIIPALSVKAIVRRS